MKKYSNAEFNELFRKRTFAFALGTLKFINDNRGLIPFVIQNQLAKAATSVGANFRAFCRGRSHKEKYSKICVVVEEADETNYWFDLIDQGGFGKPDGLLPESEEILRVVVSIKSNMNTG